MPLLDSSSRNGTVAAYRAVKTAPNKLPFREFVVEGKGQVLQACLELDIVRPWPGALVDAGGVVRLDKVLDLAWRPINAVHILVVGWEPRAKAFSQAGLGGLAWP